MKLLFITAFPPNQHTAGQDYTRRLIFDLINKGHKISVIYATYTNHEIEMPEQIEILKTIKPSKINCLKRPWYHPIFTKRFVVSVLHYIQQISQDYDMLYFDFSQVHIYSLYIKHPNKVLMCHDVIAQKYSRTKKWQSYWIKRSESTILKTAKHIITFSNKDCEYIKQNYGLESIPVNFYLKNGRFKYKELAVASSSFCFYGAWNRAENSECLEWFFKAVYSKINTEINFIIIGGGMSDSLKMTLSGYRNVSCLGFVDDPLIEIAKCQALIAPLRKGAGVKVKVIDALSCGTPVIGTSIAFEGIEDNAENQLFHYAENLQQFTDILQNWQQVYVNYKQLAANEFFERYNKNHFTDILIDIS